MFNRMAPCLRVREPRQNMDPAALGRSQGSGRWKMTFVPVMWIVWSAIVVITAGLYIYRSNLTRDEEDQIFLDDSFSHEQAAQAAIVARVHKIEPVLRIAQVLVVAMTAVVLFYYARDILVHLNILS